MLCLLILVSVVLVATQRIPDNPCPDFFSYEMDGDGYYGEINLPNDRRSYVKLEVDVSFATYLLDDETITLDLINQKDVINGADPIYRIAFPIQHVLPKITKIIFNDRLYCFGHAETFRPERGLTNLWSSTSLSTTKYRRPARQFHHNIRNSSSNFFKQQHWRQRNQFYQAGVVENPRWANPDLTARATRVSSRLIDWNDNNPRTTAVRGYSENSRWENDELDTGSGSGETPPARPSNAFIRYPNPEPMTPAFTSVAPPKRRNPTVAIPKRRKPPVTPSKRRSPIVERFAQ